MMVNTREIEAVTTFIEMVEDAINANISTSLEANRRNAALALVMRMGQEGYGLIAPDRTQVESAG
jgi:hypothetical protein